MEHATQEHEVESEMRAAELATLYGGSDDAGTPYPMLVEPWEDDPWEADSEIDPQIYAGLLRLAP
jgi:hypothetical protein